MGWEEAGHIVEERLGPKNAIINPAARAHYFRNDGVADMEFMLLAGTARVADVRFQAAWPVPMRAPGSCAPGTPPLPISTPAAARRSC